MKVLRTVNPFLSNSDFLIDSIDDGNNLLICLSRKQLNITNLFSHCLLFLDYTLND
jgi:hypothetical protein